MSRSMCVEKGSREIIPLEGGLQQRQPTRELGNAKILYEYNAQMSKHLVGWVSASEVEVVVECKIGSCVQFRLK